MMGQGESHGPIDPALAGFLTSGVAIMAATRDGDLQPEIARGWGPGPSADGARLDLCLIAPSGSATRANLEANVSIAVNCTRPSTYRAVQIKGRVTEVRAPTEDDLARAAEHAEAFTADTAKVGSPAPSAFYIGAVDLAVTLEVDELYDQTPGPAAGSRL
ncbi:MAG TPA: hypothetical protein VFJ99_06270 [Solirubrobacterales bacterium]|nr:hypothetical protein [Solirubrobacterales bacterium]